MKNKTLKTLELNAKAFGLNCESYVIEKAKMVGQRGYVVYGVTKSGEKYSLMSGLSYRQTQDL
jgi:hypothetical protein